jgi:hypothetical protein
MEFLRKKKSSDKSEVPLLPKGTPLRTLNDLKHLQGIWDGYMALCSAFSPEMIQTPLNSRSSSFYQRISKVWLWVLRTFLYSGLGGLVKSLKTLCDHAAWLAVESTIAKAEPASDLLGSNNPFLVWFGRTLDQEELFLLRSWKRAFPHPGKKKEVESLEKFKMITSTPFDCEIKEQSRQFIKNWFSRVSPKRGNPSISVVTTTSAFFETTSKDGGKAVAFRKIFLEFLSLPSIGIPLEEFTDAGGLLMDTFKDLSLMALFWALAKEDRLGSCKPEEFEKVPIGDVHEFISGILDPYSPPSDDEPLYESKVVPISEQGWKCRIVTTASTVVCTALQLLREAYYYYLRKDHYCLVLFKGYSYNSLGAWKGYHKGNLMGRIGRNTRFLSTDLTSATDTFSRELISEMNKTFVSEFTQKFPKFRYLRFVAPLVSCPQSYILPNKEVFRGERGTPMGNPANWALLNLVNEFALDMACSHLSQGLSYDEIPQRLSGIDVPAVFCGDDNLTISDDPQVFRLYEKYISKCGGMISPSSHFESASTAFFTEIPYDRSLNYLNVPKVKMLVGLENRLDKTSNPSFYKAESFSKAVMYLTGDETLEKRRRGLSTWFLMRNHELVKRVLREGLSVHLPRIYGGWDFLSPSGRVKRPTLLKRALKYLLRDDKSTEFILQRYRLSSIWDSSKPVVLQGLVNKYLMDLMASLEYEWTTLEDLCALHSLDPPQYGDLRALRSVSTKLKELGYQNTEEVVKSSAERLYSLPSGALGQVIEGLNRSFTEVGKDFKKARDEILHSHHRSREYGSLRIADLGVAESLRIRFQFKASSLWVPVYAVMDASMTIEWLFMDEVYRLTKNPEVLDNIPRKPTRKKHTKGADRSPGPGPP